MRRSGSCHTYVRRSCTRRALTRYVWRAARTRAVRWHAARGRAAHTRALLQGSTRRPRAGMADARGGASDCCVRGGRLGSCQRASCALASAAGAGAHDMRCNGVYV